MFLCVYTALFILLKYFGLFQPLELNLYDHYWQRSPIEAPDPKIVIVGIDEGDLNEVNWPITNEDLANLIGKIQEQNPVVIGLDIFRDLGVSGQLKQIFEESDQLVGIGLHKEVAFPPILKGRKRVGTVAVVDEPVFGELRRIYLYSLTDGSKESRIPYISLRLVEEYLKKQGNLEMTGDEATGYLKVNGKVIPRTEHYSGGYNLKGYEGYPYLVRWRKGNYQEEQWEDRFAILTYQEAMAAQKDTFSDKIVFIGYRAESIKDKFITPLGWRYGVDIAAQTTSDLLSHIENNRPIFQFIPEGVEYGLLILMIAWAYSHYHFSRLTKVWREIIIQGAILGLSLGIIYGLGYLSFRQGLWIPVGQLLLAYGVSVMLFLAMKYQLKVHRINQELEYRLKEREKELEKLYEQRAIEEKQIVMGQLAANMAHDLNTQLAVLRMEQTYMERRFLSALEVAQWLFLIEEPEDLEWLAENEQSTSWQELDGSLSAQKEATNLLKESLDILQATYQGHCEEPTEFDVNQELERILDKWQGQLSQQGIRLEFSPCADGKIFYSRRTFRQIVNHLIQNGKEAIVEKGETTGEIKVETIKESQRLKMVIRDNGSGMTPSVKEQAKNFQFSTKKQGMGYGLYFVTSQLGENIQWLSEPEQGTAMILWF